MASHNELGVEGENLAAKWMEKNGFKIVQRNWRYSYYEIDLIAMKGDTLCFIEIKTRNASPFGYPEDSVTRKKFKRLQRAADEYLFQNPGYKWIQYHILSITLRKNGEVEYFLLEDVFLY
jgi:putative endonuclease